MEEWGRDTFISLSGLLLTRKKTKEAKAIFLRFAEYEKNGLIPNRINLKNNSQENKEIIYNTVDASLWFLIALENYFKIKNDRVFKKKIIKTVRSIISNYQKGTSYKYFNTYQEIKMDKDGLILSPPQATWMDADPSGTGQQIITPRNGKAVEINTLWFSVLCFTSDLEFELKNKKRSRELAKLSRKVKKSFNQKFWNISENCLLDVIEGDPHSGAIRPNQIFAISHGKKLLTKVKQQQVFTAVTNDLLTPAGLRSLSPRDSNYKGIYHTNDPLSQKDLAYHQGTAWVWLIGAYCDSLSIVFSNQKKSTSEIKNKLKKILSPLVLFCMESEHKSLPEVFSGDFPYESGGTTSQAWSIAEVFRILVSYKII
jgi:predicted glycogen debranching enzyme